MYRRLIIILILISSSCTLMGQREFKSAVFFNSGKSKLRDDAKRSMDSLLSKTMKINKYSRMKLVGHTDSVGDYYYNINLSEERIDAVTKYMHEKKVEYVIEKFPDGEKNAGYNNHNDIDRHKNRRVDIIITEYIPDTDTVIRNGCASVSIKANTFLNYKNLDLEFKLDVIEPIAKDLLSNNTKNFDSASIISKIVKFTIYYKGEPIIIYPQQEIKIAIPSIIIPDSPPSLKLCVLDKNGHATLGPVISSNGIFDKDSICNLIVYSINSPGTFVLCGTKKTLCSGWICCKDSTISSYVKKLNTEYDKIERIGEGKIYASGAPPYYYERGVAISLNKNEITLANAEQLNFKIQYISSVCDMLERNITSLT